jgi:hypothetical protein
MNEEGLPRGSPGSPSIVEPRSGSRPDERSVSRAGPRRRRRSRSDRPPTAAYDTLSLAARCKRCAASWPARPCSCHFVGHEFLIGGPVDPTEVASVSELVHDFLHSPTLHIVVLLATLGMVQSVLILALVLLMRTLRREILAMQRLRQSWREHAESVHQHVLELVLRLLQQGRPASEDVRARHVASDQANPQPVPPLTERERSRAH